MFTCIGTSTSDSSIDLDGIADLESFMGFLSRSV